MHDQLQQVWDMSNVPLYMTIEHLYLITEI